MSVDRLSLAFNRALAKAPMYQDEYGNPVDTLEEAHTPELEEPEPLEPEPVAPLTIAQKALRWAYRPEKSGAFGQLIKRVKPPAGYHPIPKGKRGGYRKRIGGEWDYWYPDTGVTKVKKEEKKPTKKEPAGRDTRPEVTILSMGLGRDSITMLLLAKEGRLMVDGEALSGDDLDAVAFSDPGWEWPHTYTQIPKVKKLCEEMNVPFYRLAKPKAEGDKGWKRYHEQRIARTEKRADDSALLSDLSLGELADLSATRISAKLADVGMESQMSLFEASDDLVEDSLARATAYHTTVKRLAKQRKTESDEDYALRLTKPVDLARGAIRFDPEWVTAANKFPSIEERAEAGAYHRRAPIIEDYERLCKITLRASAACTANQKILPISSRLLNDMSLDKFGVSTSTGAWGRDVKEGERPQHRMLIGIAADETSRLEGAEAAAQKSSFVRPVHPLADMGIKKGDEQKILEKHGFGDVRKSGCVGCHFQPTSWYWALKETQPDSYQKVVDYERRAIEYAKENKMTVKYLKGSRPLDGQVDEWREKNPNATVDAVLDKEYDRKASKRGIVLLEDLSISISKSITEGVVPISWAYSPCEHVQKSLPGPFSQLLKRMTPPPGYTPAPHGTKGGYRKRSGGEWDYWYPDPLPLTTGRKSRRQMRLFPTALDVVADLEPDLGAELGQFKTAKELERTDMTGAAMASNYYVSGSNSAAEIRGFANLGQPVGVAVDQLTPAGIKELKNLAGRNVPVFVDSGAFGEFGGADITDDEWQRRLDVYEELAQELGPQLAVVAPDKVGDQAGTIERMARYKDQIERTRSHGSRVILPLQRGEKTLAEFEKEAVNALGLQIDGGYVVGIPLKKEATRIESVREYLQERQPPAIHLLGMGATNHKIKEVVQMTAELSPTTVLTMDSNWIRANVGRGEKPRRLTATQDRWEHEVARVEKRVSDLRAGRVRGNVGASRVRKLRGFLAELDVGVIGKNAGLKGSKLSEFVDSPHQWLSEKQPKRGRVLDWIEAAVLERRVLAPGAKKQISIQRSRIKDLDKGSFDELM